MNGINTFDGLGIMQIIFKVSMEGSRPIIKEDVPDVYRKLIERCWSQLPEDRPSFEEIVNDLKSNQEFITESTNEIDFRDYVDYIDKYHSTFDSSNRCINFKDFIKSYGRNKALRAVSLNSDEMHNKFGKTIDYNN